MNSETVIFYLLDAAFNQDAVSMRIGGHLYTFDNIFQVLLPQTPEAQKNIDGFRGAHANVDTTAMIHAKSYLRVRTHPKDAKPDDDTVDFIFEPSAVSMIETTGPAFPL